jgi:hypothetical protein
MVRFLLEIAQENGKTLDPVGKFLASGDRFSAYMVVQNSETAINMGISCDFRIGRGLAITQVIKTS